MSQAASSLQCFSLFLSRQRWLPYKTRRSLIKRLYPTMLRNFPFDAPFFESGWGMRFQGNIVNSIDRLVYFCGAHEKYMLILLRNYVLALNKTPKALLTFMDVGANAGNYSLFMSKLVDRVLAFEPSERVRRQLEYNVSLNRLSNVSIYPFGLSNEDKIVPYPAIADHNADAPPFHQQHRQNSYYLGDLTLRRGDEVVSQENIASVDILKADVGGYEKFVLEGLRETFGRNRPLIIIKLSVATQATLADEKEFYGLFPQDYRFFYFKYASYNTGGYRLSPFEYGCHLKIQVKVQNVIACPLEKLPFLRMKG